VSVRSLDGRWFGTFEFAPGACGRWQVGALTLVVERAAGEWRVWHALAPADPADGGAARFDADAAPPRDQPPLRYVVADRSGALRLSPLLPDRSVVARPLSPVYVPAGETVRLYVSVPLWLRLEAGAQAPYRRLLEVGCMQLSDTWFGPDTISGELCYALRSRCRLDPGSARPPYRAVTPLVIHNRFRECLALERVKVPVRQLSLYAEPHGQLWTNELALERTEDGDLAGLRVGAAAPAEAAAATLVAAPRDRNGRKGAMHAFSALFQS